MTAAMVAAGVAALTMLVIVVVAADVRVVAEISGQQRMDSCVGITANAFNYAETYKKTARTGSYRSNGNVYDGRLWCLRRRELI